MPRAALPLLLLLAAAAAAASAAAAPAAAAALRVARRAPARRLKWDGGDVSTKPYTYPLVGPETRVHNCSDLNTTLAFIRLEVHALSPPNRPRAYRVLLGCGAGDDYTSCAAPDGRLMVMLVEGKAAVTIAADPASCQPGARPTVGGTGSGGGGARLFKSARGAALTLDGIIIDGAGGRAGVQHDGPGGKLLLQNTDVVNCAADAGAALLVTASGGAGAGAGGARPTVTIVGGSLSRNAAAGRGGAVFVDLGAAPSPGAFVTLRGTTLEGNSAAEGGAVAVSRGGAGASAGAGPSAAATVKCSGCAFGGNAATARCGVLIAADEGGAGARAGRLTVDLTGSTFSGNAAPGGLAVCGMVSGAAAAAGAGAGPSARGVASLEPVAVPDAAVDPAVNAFAYRSLPPAGRR